MAVRGPHDRAALSHLSPLGFPQKVDAKTGPHFDRDQTDRYAGHVCVAPVVRLPAVRNTYDPGMRSETPVQATFTPNDDQPPWTGQLRQTVNTRVIAAGNETIPGTSRVSWDRPIPPVGYFPAAVGKLEIEGKPPCDAWWGNGRFNHSGGFTPD